MSRDLWFDLWYGDEIKDVASVSCYFSDIDNIYRGNLYNADGKIIGDYTASDWMQVERVFKVTFY